MVNVLSANVLSAARKVLKALIPEDATLIKGDPRSHRELLASSGNSSEAFADVLRALDNDARLITPVERPETSDASAAEKHYQLTHDHLVPALREWLNRKQKETRRGRAEILLEERAAAPKFVLASCRS